MRFLVIDPAQVEAETVRFTREQEHYLSRVLRKHEGDTIEVVVAGAGRVLAGPLSAGKRGTLTLWVSSERELPPPPSPPLTLVMGLIRGPRLEAVVRTATELGVARLSLVSAERAVVDWSKGGREDRLAGIAIAACQQSGNPYPPKIERFDSLASALSFGIDPQGTVILGVASGGQSLAALRVRADRPVAILIGPEGDWSPDEVLRARGAGADCLTLSGHVLRAESAALVLAALMLARIGRL